MKDRAKSNKIHPDISLRKQTGWTCQLYAIEGVLEWLYSKHLIKSSPLPARKRDGENASCSLRQLAKEKFHSTTGEMNSIEDILNLANENPEIVASALGCRSEEEYSNILVNMVDYNLAAIVFFEVDPPTGQPQSGTFENDHAAIVVGYQRDKDGQLQFVLSQWQKEYLVPARDLFQSSNQDAKSRAEIPTFVKVRTRSEKTAWYPSSHIGAYFSNPTKLDERRAITDIRKSDFKAKIVIIDSAQRITNFIDLIRQKVASLSAKNSNVAKLEVRELKRLLYSINNNACSDALYTHINMCMNSHRGRNISKVDNQRLQYQLSRDLFSLFKMAEKEVQGTHEMQGCRR